ncbi:phage tail protein [Candidatus Tokpelaia sp.]|uniref:phage tail protein n=1 Tax=Candidatus Tokpelaia sp. TaxID=2233777 RepID=UPI0016809640|nr:phage tail protein [Candidatus Tokpelaia sp.]
MGNEQYWPSHLLPANSTRWEICLADACAFSPVVHQSISALTRLKFIDRPISILPYLLDEYGLQVLIPYIPNLYDLLDKAVPWQRSRGTIAAVQTGLSWLGYAAEYRPTAPSRNWWNAYSLIFIQIPAPTDLERIEGIVSLSECLRSDFRRGAGTYDVPAFEGDETKIDNAILDSDSGIALRQTVWSFGRCHEYEHMLTEAEGVALGNWIEPNNTGIKWVDAHFFWSTAEYPWADYNESQRAQIMTQWFDRRQAWLCFRAGDIIIGYRACRACAAALNGAYNAFQSAFEPALQSSCVYIEAMTGFGDVQSSISTPADNIALIFSAKLAPSVPAGRLWLAPGELLEGVEIAKKPIEAVLRRSVREQIKIILKV